jgi:hypothetical protein
MQESSVRPTAVEYGGGPGRGIAQWSVGGRFNTGRHNLTTLVGGYGLTEIRAATTLTAAVTAFQNKFERCGTCAQAKRMQYAQQALTDFGGSTPTGGGTTPPPPTTTTCRSGTLDRDMPENACVESMFDGLWYQCSSGSWVDRWSNPNACNGEYPL